MQKITSFIVHNMRWFFIGALIIVTALMLGPSHKQPEGWDYLDKLEHLSAFAGLTLMGLIAYPRYFKSVIIGLIVYGGVMEILQQTLTTTRIASGLDWLADILGVLLMWGICLFLNRKRV